MATTRNELEARMQKWWDRLRTFRAAKDIHIAFKSSRWGLRILDHHINNCLTHLQNIGLQLLELQTQSDKAALALIELERKEMTANG